MKNHFESNDNSFWLQIHKTLRNQLKCYGSNDFNTLKIHEKYKRRLIDIIKRTSVMGESNSVLIIGPRGSGKSTLLDIVIQELDAVTKDNFLLVSLNGLVHIDDNLALKDIMVQLKLEGIGDKVVGSFSEKLSLLLEAFKSGSKRSKSILFVLDEFDLFCNHKDQTLLYNLFDVVQSQQSPICVIGLSCRPDVLHKLENRVKSRFSHQQIYLFDNIEFSDYVQVANQILSLPLNSDIQGVEKWNDSIKHLTDQSTVLDILKKCYSYSHSIRDLKKFLFYIVLKVGPLHPEIEPGDFINAFNFFTKDLKCLMIQGLSVLEVSLIISMMHLTELYDGEPFNLEMVYHEYKKFLQKQMSFQNVDKAVVMKAFEHLLAIEIVKEVNYSGNISLKRFMPVRLLLEPSQIRETLKLYPNLPSQLQQWAMSNIVE